ncbi:MAG: Gfo/Idh/MocA family protein [Anaerolineales bacterium]
MFNAPPLRLGFLGCAHAHHAASYAHVLTQTPGVTMTAIYDDDVERGQSFAQRFGVPHFYSAIDELLARDDIHAVVVCSPTNQHAPLTMAAAQAGKHVLCEKPIATTADDARAMIEACRENGVQLLKFRGGATASLDPSWSISPRNPYHYDFYLRIVGIDGVLSLDDRRQALHIVSESAADRNVYLEPFGVDVDAAMVRHFVQCVRQGDLTPPAASGEDGLRALEIGLAAYQSAHSGQPVTV